MVQDTDLVSFNFTVNAEFQRLRYRIFLGNADEIEHVWGVGHVAMKVGLLNEGLKAVGFRTDSVGLSIGSAQEGYHIELGWSSHQQLDVVDQNTQLCLAWPSGSFYNARVGSEFPPEISECGHEEKEKEP